MVRGRSGVPSYFAAFALLVVLNFALPRMLPGDPLRAILSPDAPTYVSNDVVRDQLAEFYGLDKPLLNQFGDHLVGLARGDLGVSIQHAVPVTTLITQRLPWTALLVVSAALLATLASVPLGIQSGWRRNRLTDRVLTSVFVAVDSFPVFFVASLAAILLAVKLRWFPLSGARTRPVPEGGLIVQGMDILHHLFLPAAVLALQFTTNQFLTMRAAMVQQLRAPYLLLARAKGASNRRLKLTYAARNAITPVVTVIITRLAFLISGSILVETVFAYPGLGSLMFEAIPVRDYPTLSACFLVLTAVVLGSSLLLERLYPILDPRTVER